MNTDIDAILIDNIECSIMISRMNMMNMTNKENKLKIEQLINDLENLKQKTERRMKVKAAKQLNMIWFSLIFRDRFNQRNNFWNIINGCNNRVTIRRIK